MTIGTAQWLQNGPVSENDRWSVLLADGFNYTHIGRWELSGGALTLISDQDEVLTAFGPNHWKWVRKWRAEYDRLHP